MKTVYYVAIALAILFAILTVYFLIPGIYHPYISLHDGTPYLLSMARYPRIVKSVHHYYAAACFIVALTCGLIALLIRTKQQVSRIA
ncbi:MAG TPA: hypothetical protein VNG51_20410 [Ktedonobacteraceae bacterium]|nr:hypothetical protein [Ktedonobacteraceae bacterium]